MIILTNEKINNLIKLRAKRVERLKGFFTPLDLKVPDITEDLLKTFGYRKLFIDRNEWVTELHEPKSEHDYELGVYLLNTLSDIEIDSLVFQTAEQIEYNKYYEFQQISDLRNQNFFQLINIKRPKFDIFRLKNEIRNRIKYETRFESKYKDTIIPDASLQTTTGTDEFKFTYYEYEYSPKDRYAKDINEKGYLKYFEDKLFNYILLYVYKLGEMRAKGIKVNQRAFKFIVNLIYKDRYYSKAKKDEIKIYNLWMQKRLQDEYPELHLFKVFRNITINVI